MIRAYTIIGGERYDGQLIEISPLEHSVPWFVPDPDAALPKHFTEGSALTVLTRSGTSRGLAAYVPREILAAWRDEIEAVLKA